MQNNFLSPLGFTFRLAIAPETNYNVQEVEIPGLQLGYVEQPSPFVRIPVAGNLRYNELRISFKVGEDMSDYLEIFNWMVALGHPDEFPQYKNVRSDGSVVILNNQKIPQLSMDFTSAFPIALSPLNFDATATDVNYMTAQATFKVTRFYFNKIG